MVAKHLARKDSRKMAMIGTGSQSEFQALGMRARPPASKTLRCTMLIPPLSRSSGRNLEPLGFRIHAASSVDEAVAVASNSIQMHAGLHLRI